MTLADAESTRGMDYRYARTGDAIIVDDEAIFSRQSSTRSGPRCHRYARPAHRLTGGHADYRLMPTSSYSLDMRGAEIHVSM
jgi:hypothetical protein